MMIRVWLKMSELNSIWRVGFSVLACWRVSSAMLSLWSSQSCVGLEGWHVEMMIAKRFLSLEGECENAASSSVFCQCLSSSKSPLFKQSSWKVAQTSPSTVRKSWNEVDPLTTCDKSHKRDHSELLEWTVYTRPRACEALTPGQGSLQQLPQQLFVSKYFLPVHV